MNFRAPPMAMPAPRRRPTMAATRNGSTARAGWCRRSSRISAASAEALRRCSTTAATRSARRSTGCATRPAIRMKASPCALSTRRPALGVSDPRLPRDAVAPWRGNAVQARDRKHLLHRARRQRLDRDRRRRLEWETERYFRRAEFLVAAPCQPRRGDAVLYAVSDMPLLEKIGQYRAQGRIPDDTVAESSLILSVSVDFALLRRPPSARTGG